MSELIAVDCLDYHITFPSSSISHENHENDEYFFACDDDKRPVIVLLGWAGCQDKYLAKYSAIYEEKGCITLRYTAPLECLFWRDDKLPNIAKQLLQVISDNSLDEHPIFFHIFSNGGALLYQHISIAMDHGDNLLQVKGVIFDSAPGQRRITSFYRATSAIIGGNLLTNIPVSCVITAFIVILWAYQVISRVWDKSQLALCDVVSLSEESHSWPQLFLYSNADMLIPAMDIEQFAHRRAERGVNVQMVLFTDSPHVKLYTSYPDAYVNTVCKFIHECTTINTMSDSMMALSSTQIVRKKYELSESKTVDNEISRELKPLCD